MRRRGRLPYRIEYGRNTELRDRTTAQGSRLSMRQVSYHCRKESGATGSPGCDTKAGEVMRKYCPQINAQYTDQSAVRVGLFASSSCERIGPGTECRFFKVSSLECESRAHAVFVVSSPRKQFTAAELAGCARDTCHAQAVTRNNLRTLRVQYARFVILTCVPAR